MSEDEIAEPSEVELADTDLELDDELVTDPADDEQLLGFRLSTLDE
ncbi:MAG: hypothetical protein AAB552_02700 [Patescibacteria group bacterium]